jgi:hypothetical protein
MKKNKKFISIIFKSKPKESEINLLIDFLKGLLGSYIEPSMNENILTVVFEPVEDLSFEEIINGLNNDFYITTSLFESGVIYDSVNVNDYIEYIASISNKILESNNYYVDENLIVKLNLCNDIIEKNIFRSYYKDEEMLEVVRAYLDSNMNISKAANMLYMHRNTVMNKIDKFIAVTGYDIKKFSNAFIIYRFL